MVNYFGCGVIWLLGFNWNTFYLKILKNRIENMTPQYICLKFGFSYI